MKKRKLPMRMCIGCREMKPKKELIRIVKDKENNISLDSTGKKPGRGAYVCKNMSCLLKVEKGRGIEKAFKTPISTQVYDGLKQQLEEDDV